MSATRAAMLRALGTVRAVRTAATTRPTKLSAFTGKPDFYESLLFLDDVLVQLQPLSTGPAASVVWLARDAMSEQLGFSLSLLQYRKICAKLSQIAAYVHQPDIASFLGVFSPDPVAAQPIGTAEPKPTRFGRVDGLGRVVAVGHRKTAVAKIFVVPGNGLLFVNGKPAHEYFQRMECMFHIAEPLRVTATLNKFNTWALVRGGGLSGQAGALRLAIARALAVADGRNAQILHPWGFLRRDLRTVERKKPGQPKARKKFTWVKR